MAKINLIKTALLAATILGGTAISAPAFAQTDQELLNQAQQAESQQYWQAAERFYRQLLQRNPRRADLWERLGDIIAQQGGRGEDAAEALAMAADNAPRDARLQTKAAKAYASIAQPERAVEYFGKAVSIDPNNAENWYSKSANESWLGRYADAEASLQGAFRAGLPRNAENLSRLATLQQWQSKQDASNATIQEMVRLDPESPPSLLALARLLSWQGAYNRAKQHLERFLAAGGDELSYRQEMAIILAWTDKPDDSLQVSTEGLEANPGDRNLRLSQVIAFNRAREYDRSFEILEGLENEFGAGDPELMELRRRFEAPLRSSISVGTGFSTDRDNIDIIGADVVYSQAIGRGSFWRFGYQGRRAKADVFSGLDRVDNQAALLVNNVFTEYETLLSKNVLGSVRVGGSFTNFNSVNRQIFQVGAKLSFRLSQDVWLNVAYNRDHYVISPRSLSLGIVRNEEYAEFVWVPDSRFYIQARFTLAQHSDTNRQKRGDLTIIRAISRKSDLKVDFGFNAVWFGYRFQFNNGYYNPDFYQRYLFPVYFTIKLSDDDNVVLTFAPGLQKDSSFNNFQFAGAASMETTHGLFRDWQLKTRWTAYVGGSESALNLAPATDYWIISGNVVLTRRF